MEAKTARPLDAFTGVTDPQVHDLELTPDWHQVALYNTSEEKVVVSTAIGGQSIRSWAKSNHETPPPTTGRIPKVRGHLYDPLMNSVKAATKGMAIKTVTFVWMQGESDLNNMAYDSYLKELLEQLQTDLVF